MIKIFLNKNEIIEFNGTMDLRIGRPVKILGQQYYIINVESTREYVKVEVSENKFSLQIDGKTVATGVINTGNTFSNKVSSVRTNPFDR